MELQMKVKELYAPGHSRAWEYLAACQYPWEILDRIGEIVQTIGASLPPDLYEYVADGVWIAHSAKIAPTAHISAPAVIGENAEVRHGAYIRGGVLVGDGCVVGNSVELKNCILFDNVQVPHYNYVGDSVLGHRAHLGAGAVTSNVKSDRSDVVIRTAETAVSTGRYKVGAFLGDGVEVGCNAVLNPGTVIGQGSSVYPLSSVRGVVPSGAIFKSGKNVEIAEKQ